MSPVHSGGLSLGVPGLPCSRGGHWRPDSHVFATGAIFPFLKGLVGGRGSTNRDFHFDWPEENQAEKTFAGLDSAPQPGACYWDIVWAKDLYFGYFLGNFLSWPQISSLGLVCFTHTQDTQILCVESKCVPKAKGVPETNVRGGGH